MTLISSIRKEIDTTCNIVPQLYPGNARRMPALVRGNGPAWVAESELALSRHSKVCCIEETLPRSPATPGSLLCFAVAGDNAAKCGMLQKVQVADCKIKERWHFSH